MRPPAKVTCERTDDEQIFYLSGDLTRERRYDLAGHIIPHVTAQRRTVLDFSGAGELDSTLLAEIILISRRLRPTEIELRNVPDKLRNLAEVYHIPILDKDSPQGDYSPRTLQLT